MDLRKREKFHQRNRRNIEHSQYNKLKKKEIADVLSNSLCLKQARNPWNNIQLHLQKPPQSRGQAIAIHNMQKTPWAETQRLYHKIISPLVVVIGSYWKAMTVQRCTIKVMEQIFKEWWDQDKATEAMVRLGCNEFKDLPVIQKVHQQKQWLRLL